MSSGCKGLKGCSGLFESSVPLNASGGGGGSTLRAFKVGIIAASSASERPASEPYCGKEVTMEANSKETSTGRRIMFLLVNWSS